MCFLIFRYVIYDRDGNGAGRGGAERWGLHPHPAWFCLAPSLPHPT